MALESESTKLKLDEALAEYSESLVELDGSLVALKEGLSEMSGFSDFIRLKCSSDKSYISSPFVLSYVFDGKRYLQNAAVEYIMSDDEYSLRFLVGDKEMIPFAPSALVE